MSLNESIVEEAAPEWFLLRHGFGGQVGEQCRAAPTLTRPLPRVDEKREAIRQLNSAIPEEGWAVIKCYLRTRFVSRLNP